MVYRGRLQHSSLKSGGQVIVSDFRVDLVSEGTYVRLHQARSVISTIRVQWPRSRPPASHQADARCRTESGKIRRNALPI